MPEISRFFGIVVYMYAESGVRHHRAHFHARVGNAEAVYAIDDLSCLEGDISRRDHRLVQAWAEIHLGELRDNWNRLLEGRAPARIPPLR